MLPDEEYAYLQAKYKQEQRMKMLNEGFKVPRKPVPDRRRPTPLAFGEEQAQVLPSKFSDDTEVSLDLIGQIRQVKRETAFFLKNLNENAPTKQKSDSRKSSSNASPRSRRSSIVERLSPMFKKVWTECKELLSPSKTPRPRAGSVDRRDFPHVSSAAMVAHGAKPLYRPGPSRSHSEPRRERRHSNPGPGTQGTKPEHGRSRAASKSQHDRRAPQASRSQSRTRSASRSRHNDRPKRTVKDNSRCAPKSAPLRPPVDYRVPNNPPPRPAPPADGLGVWKNHGMFQPPHGEAYLMPIEQAQVVLRGKGGPEMEYESFMKRTNKRFPPRPRNEEPAWPDVPLEQVGPFTTVNISKATFQSAVPPPLNIRKADHYDNPHTKLRPRQSFESADFADYHPPPLPHGPYTKYGLDHNWNGGVSAVTPSGSKFMEHL